MRWIAECLAEQAFGHRRIAQRRQEEVDSGTGGIDGPIEVTPTPFTQNVGLIDSPGFVGQLEITAQPLFQFGAITLHRSFGPVRSTRKAPVPRGQRRGVETQLMIPGEIASTTAGIDPALLRVVACAHCWFSEVASGAVTSASQIAQRERLTHSYLPNALPLGLLAPSVVEAICSRAAARHPHRRTAEAPRPALARVEDPATTAWPLVLHWLPATFAHLDEAEVPGKH